jgi:RNA polymerase sigma factor (TIGR02999 family)
MAHEPAAQTLQSTALVHEAYLRLLGGEEVKWGSRSHFFKAASVAMRRIRVEAARRRMRLRRGGDRARFSLDQRDAIYEKDPVELLAVDEALGELARVYPRKAEIVTLRYFGGLTVDETAEALDVSPRTVDSEWRFARAWLHRRLDVSTAALANERPRASQ